MFEKWGEFQHFEEWDQVQHLEGGDANTQAITQEPVVLTVEKVHTVITAEPDPGNNAVEQQ